MGAVPSRYSGSPAWLALTVIVPTCEPSGHLESAKSETAQVGTAFGLPNTTQGKFTTTLCAASGRPGSPRLRLAPRSGCPPALVVVVVTPKEAIDCEAAARSAPASATKVATRTITTLF